MLVVTTDIVVAVVPLHYHASCARVSLLHNTQRAQMQVANLQFATSQITQYYNASCCAQC